MKLRSWGLWWFGLVMQLVFVALMVGISLMSDSTWGDILLLGSLFAAVCYLVAQAVMFPYVQVSRTGVVVVNRREVWQLDWRAVVDVTAEDGLSFELAEGEPVESDAFESSLINGLRGYPAARRAVRKIKEFRATGVVVPGSRKGVTCDFPWRLHACWVVGSWVTLALVVPALVRLLSGNVPAGG